MSISSPSEQLAMQIESVEVELCKVWGRLTFLEHENENQFGISPLHLKFSSQKTELEAKKADLTAQIVELKKQQEQLSQG